MQNILLDVRWGIIGCGNVTEVKSGPALSEVPNSKLVAVMRREKKLAEDYAKRHGVPRWYGTAEELIGDPEVNAVYIATPPAYHKEYTIQAAKAGKAVYVEKPMARTHAECLEMIEACKTYNVPLFVAYYRRALPKFLKIKELIEEGAIGEVRFVSTTQYQPITEVPEEEEMPWRLQKDLAGGGLFYDLASHTLDYLDFLLGPIKEVRGFASNQTGRFEVEDIVSGSYIFESSVHGTGTWCFSAFDREDRNEIVGTKGSIRFSTFGQSPIQLRTRDREEEWMIENPLHIQRPLIQKIVEELTGTGESPSTGETAARTNLVLEKFV
ncbi:Gfo/Idh/MocA family protein [Alkalicoccus daliensis]|uniref:Predicted dehydrogenase n=1 Tax=Alkalicoccus daliensis TaxID=745820 RepID=A0A1H0F319_9BACI|nr:Predicted dehydrogenase [Alkalicoccus daliensis]